MESLGKYLKAERELRNLSLEEAAKSTKIRKQFLKAVEEDKYELLPSTVYVKGFLTIYAKYLGLNPNDIVLRYQNYLKSLTISFPPDSQQQITTPEKRVRPRLFFFLIFAIILFIVIFIYYISNKPLIRLSPSFEEKESRPVPLSSVPSKVGTPTTYQAEQRQISKPKGLKAKDIITTESPFFEVLEASMGTGIEREGDRLIMTGKCSEFPCKSQRAYFFTRIRTQREGKIAHVWLWEGKEFHRVEIEVIPPAWSVYSYLTLRPHLNGNWKAEARYGDHVLTTISFKATGFPDYSIKGKE
jgi:transcriptional regulator with XRE-family HTH domain